MLGKVFARFVEKSPVSVMVRGTLERVLGAEQLDAWFARTAQKQYTRTLFALLTVSKKWTCDLSMTRVASWRHILETHMNRFALILQVHDTKPLDDLAYQASIRQG